jgi:hypothetical protein
MGQIKLVDAVEFMIYEPLLAPESTVVPANSPGFRAGRRNGEQLVSGSNFYVERSGTHESGDFYVDEYSRTAGPCPVMETFGEQRRN